MARSIFALTLFALAIAGSQAHNSFKCLLSNCGKELMTCGTTPNCLSGMYCMSLCGGKMECTYECWATYYSDTLNDMVDCAIGRHQCITPPDVHPTVCRKPNSLAKDFDLKYLTGKFYNVYGLNELYECRDYSHKYFEKKNNGSLLLTEWYDLKTMDGKARTFKDQQVFSVENEDSPSVLSVTTVGKGMRREDEYRVLSYSDTYVFVYYCGKTCGISYEGAVVYSRTPEISEEDRMAVKKEAAARGWDLDKFCKPKQKAVM